MKQKVKKQINAIDKNGHSRKMDVEVDVTKLLSYSSKERSADLVAHTKAVIDNMIKDGTPLTASRIALNAGCSKSFIYKNQEIREYLNSKDIKPKAHKNVYSSLEEANKRIRELEVQNMELLKENTKLYQEVIYLIDKSASIIELNAQSMEEVTRRIKNDGKK